MSAHDSASHRDYTNKIAADRNLVSLKFPQIFFLGQEIAGLFFLCFLVASSC